MLLSDAIRDSFPTMFLVCHFYSLNRVSITKIDNAKIVKYAANSLTPN